MATFFIIILIFFLTFFSVGVMSFISMASPVGPWIDVTLMLLAMLIVKLCGGNSSLVKRYSMLGYSTAASAIGGSVATACGFAFPTLYFLKPELFASILHAPLHFMSLMVMLVLSAGSLGMLIAHICAPYFLSDPSMTFPIGHMTYSLMSVGDSIRKSYELLAGLLTAAAFNVLQFFSKIVPKKIVICKEYLFGCWAIPSLIIRPDWILMLIAIGFVTGHVVAIPLIVGVIIKIFAADPFHHYFLPSLPIDDFFFAFCTGIIVQSTFLSFIELPNYMYNFFKKNKAHTLSFDFYKNKNNFLIILSMFFLSSTSVFLYSLHFTFISQLYLILIAAFFTYQIAVIGGKTGLAPIGRFATWLMFPFLIIFGCDPMKLTIVATFMEISGMVVVDTLFGRKMAQLAHLDNKKIMWYQFLGLIISACSVAIIFWLLINHFGLGASSPLIVQRCQARAFLINASSFNYYVMLFGIAVGFVLRSMQINSTLVLGGLLLPLDFSCLLIFGGMLTYIVKNKDYYIPFWSGVFAASALFMLFKTFI